MAEAGEREHVVTELAGDEHADAQHARQDGRSHGREKDGHRHDREQLEVDKAHSDRQPPRRAPGHDPVDDEQEQPHAGHHGEHGGRQAQELAPDELRAAHRLGEDDEHGALVDLLVHQACRHEHGHDEPKEAHGHQAEVLHHAPLLPQADASQPQAGHDHEQGEEHDHGEHPVADRLTERVAGDGEHARHCPTIFTKNASRSPFSPASASWTAPCQTTSP